MAPKRGPGASPAARSAAAAAASRAAGSRSSTDDAVAAVAAAIRAEMAAVSPMHSGGVQLYTRTAERICALWAPAEARGSQRRPPASELAQLLHLVRPFSSFAQLCGVRSLAEWAQPVLQHRAAARAAALLNTQLDSYEELAAGEQARAGSDRDEAIAAVAMDQITSGLFATVRTLSSIWEAFDCTPPARAQPTDPATLGRLRAQLLEQLTGDGEVVRALARVPGFVEKHIWPIAGDLAMPGVQYGAEAARYGCLLLSVSAAYVTHVVGAVTRGARPGGGGGGGGGGISLDPQRRLAEVARSGLVASLSAALLAAPPHDPQPRAAKGDPQTGDYREGLRSCQWDVMWMLMSVAGAVPRVGPQALALLDSPQVWQLQREALRQVAALAVDRFAPRRQSGEEGSACGSRAGGGGVAAGDRGRSGRGGRGGGGGGGGRARSRAASGGDSSRSSPRGGGSGEASGEEGGVRMWPLLQEASLRSDTRQSWTRQLFNMETCVFAALVQWNELSGRGEMAAAARVARELLPSRTQAAELGARVLAAMHACTSALGAREGDAPSSAAAAHVKAQQRSPRCGGLLARMVLFRMRGATDDELESCLPGLLEMAAWRVGLGAAMLAEGGGSSADDSPDTLPDALSALLQGSVHRMSETVTPAEAIVTFSESQEATFWRRVHPATRAACIHRLTHPTDMALPRWLDALLRASVSRGGWNRLAQVLAPQTDRPVVLTGALAELLGDLLRARLPATQRGPEQEQPRRAGECEGEYRGAGGSSGSGSRRGPGQGGWQAKEDIGLVLSALKLLRREVALGLGGGEGGGQALRAFSHSRLGLASFVANVGLSNWGLPGLVREMRRAEAGGAGDGGGGSGAGRPRGGVAGTEAAMVTQAVAACGSAVLPYMLQMVECAISELQREARVGGGRSAPQGLAAVVTSGLLTAQVAAAAVVSAAQHLPPEVLLAAAPQRLLAAAAQLLKLLREVQGLGVLRVVQGEEASTFGARILSAVLFSIRDAVILMSAEEQLLDRCVPGWLWAGPLGGDAVAGLTIDLDPLTDLYQQAGARVDAPAAAPRCPIIVVDQRADPAAARFDLRDWATEQGQRRGEVAAMARGVAQGLGLMEGSVWREALAAAAAGAGGGAAGAGQEGDAGMWPPRLVRLCGNPLCGDFSGGSEAELKLRWCSKCCAVRYCGAACQRAHWPGHKADCGRWAGRWTAEG
ncbi:hypothetical protein PLESTB_001529200 [Pleodorina starrii]|uniref:MYND-type domain-containing protein n=1 Tax=Pleodorina starrii TaxID=330485 RepID=A0A9W6BWW5_9CHLO|nr:hypothetical protein PLESTM_001164400 [Pleodorina starrii]GLC59747.1 hypothetical protein PLESTB_001529200 [Pleodorina starrii]GLC75331.1 hypothetical protein PLESTF_001624700 [Pleodorina starrii]